MSRIHEALKRAEEEAKVHLSSAVVPDSELLSDVSIEQSEDIQLELIEDSASDASGQIHFAEDRLKTIPFHKWTPDVKKLLFSDLNHHYEPGMEEFRTLRSRLYQIREKTPTKTIMVASALPEEGKTFISSNLAYALVRQHGRRVLLIDADVRKPHMHKCMGASGQPGLNEYLAGTSDEAAILQRGPLENLFFIPGGCSVPNPSELISNGRLKLLLERLAPLFHWIIVDSPPIVPISDGSMIARFVDGIVLVVRAESTPVDMAQRAKEELKDHRLLGVVLNRAEQRSAKSSYHYTYGPYGRKDSKG